MGTTYQDVSRLGAEEGKIRYGITGTIIKTKEGEKKSSAVTATEQELKDRKTNALKYKSILDAVFLPGEKIVNEVVMAYRSHNSHQFPMFGQWIKAKKFFRVLNSDTLQPTGPVITNSGQYLAQEPAPILLPLNPALRRGAPPIPRGGFAGAKVVK